LPVTGITGLTTSTRKIRTFSTHQVFLLIVKMASFAMIGCVNLAVDLSAFTLAYAVLHLPLVISNLLAWLIVTSGSYVMNTMVTFRSETKRIMRRKDYLRFALAGVLGVIVSTTTLVILSSHVSVAMAKLAAVGAGFVVNFTMSNFVVFRQTAISKLPS
jgi:putative flippase GtrA